jgi:rubrerythrin
MNTLDIQTLFTIAMNNETEAYEFYRAASQKVSDVNVREIFSELANDELGHYELLNTYRKDASLHLKISAPASDWKISEAEELPKLEITMKPKEAIVLAMKKEQQAVEFYQKLSKSAIDTGVKEMLENLAHMELSHKHRLESMFVDIGFPESF